MAKTSKNSDQKLRSMSQPSNDPPLPSGLSLPPWQVLASENKLVDPTTDEVIKLEPKVMQLLLVLLTHANTACRKETLISKVWPDVIVTEDALARGISKLRKLLGDDSKPYKVIETIPKVGYKLVVSTAPLYEPNPGNRTTLPQRRLRWTLVALLLVGVIAGSIWRLSIPQNDLLSRADTLYVQFKEDLNQSAQNIYRQLLNQQPDNADALAGLANTLVQQVIRWPVDYPHPSEPSLRLALSQGATLGGNAERLLFEAQAHAERAVRLKPDSTKALKALAFVYSAQNQLQPAQALYEKALVIQPSSWRVAVNLGELALINNDLNRAIDLFERAYHSMEKAFEKEPYLIGVWIAQMGLVVAQLHEQNQDRESARAWYKEVLTQVPGNEQALDALLRLEAAQ